MGGAQELIERIKYADSALKKKVVLGSLAAVLFVFAAVLLIGALRGPEAVQPDTQTERAVAELRKELASDEPPEVIEEDIEPFQPGGQQAPQ